MRLWCEECGQPFDTDPYFWHVFKFCSEKCMNRFIRAWRERSLG